MSRFVRPVLASLALALALLAAGASTAFALDAKLADVGATFNAPIYVTAPPGDDSRLFVVERGGTIQLLRGATKTTFLNISGKVSVGGERGLLSMAFAPDYATSGRFYVYYTDVGGDIVIEQYARSSDPNAADPNSGRALISPIEHSQFDNHNGGQLQFGPDGYLYAGTGDGGSSGDPNGNGQNTASLLGKLLRIDTSTGRGAPGNLSGGLVFDYGLRNPYRFSFDRATGDLVIGDVGQDAREEIDRRAAGSAGGANFGWNVCEGDLAYPSGGACSAPPSYVAPVLDYSHAGGNCAITGGYVVRDPSLAALNGRYVYGDFCASRLRTVDLANPAGDRAVDSDVTLPVSSLVSFGEDARGCVYVVSTPGGANSGKVYRMQSPTGANPCPASSSGGGSGGGGAGGGAGSGGAVQLDASAKKRQRILVQKGLRFAVRCSANCTLYTRASVKLEGSKRKLSLVRLKRSLAAGSRTLVRIGLTKKERKALSGALVRGRTGLAKVVLSVRDASLGLDRSTRRVRVLR